MISCSYIQHETLWVSWRCGLELLWWRILLFCPPTGYSEKGDSSSEDVESQSLDLYRSQLLRLIERDPENFADNLLSAHIISEQVCTRAKQRFTNYSARQARELLKVVKNIIQVDPGKFRDFLEVVNQYSPSLANELTYTCGRLLLKPLITIHSRLLSTG